MDFKWIALGSFYLWWSVGRIFSVDLVLGVPSEQQALGFTRWIGQEILTWNIGIHWQRFPEQVTKDYDGDPGGYDFTWEILGSSPVFNLCLGCSFPMSYIGFVSCFTKFKLKEDY